MIKHPLLLLFTLILTASCCRAYHYGYEIENADEFVIDSYKIRQGKLSILDMQGDIIGELPADALNEYKDAIHDDDILTIVVYHPTRTDIMNAVSAINASIGYRVTGGQIALPDIPPVSVTGLTLEEARLAIQNEYLRHISDMEVFLAYKDRITRKVELAGLTEIGSIPIDGRMRLYELLAHAHIPSNANLFKSYIIRDGVLLPIDFFQLIKEGDMKKNIVMHAGDKIYIAPPEDSRVMIMGEVGTPRPLNLPYGSMSLREALVAAGGIPYTGDKRYIQIIRGSLTRPKIYTLSWNHIVHLPNESLLLMPGDTVYVSAKPITEWNRFISQLLPSFSGVATTHSTARMLGI